MRSLIVQPSLAMGGPRNSCLEQFSNGVNNYTRGNGSGTSRKNDFPALPGIERGVPKEPASEPDV
jgi:hypothetical protein